MAHPESCIMRHAKSQAVGALSKRQDHARAIASQNAGIEKPNLLPRPALHKVHVKRKA